MSDEYAIIICPDTKWESEPMPEREATELLEGWASVHPFEGTCRTVHYIVYVTE